MKESSYGGWGRGKGGCGDQEKYGKQVQVLLLRFKLVTSPVMNFL